MSRLLVRTAVALLSRSLLWLTLSAAIILCALRYGPTLVASVLPEDVRPAPGDVAKITPQQLVDALKDIRGALE